MAIVLGEFTYRSKEVLGLSYVTIIPRAHVRYEIIDSVRVIIQERSLRTKFISCIAVRLNDLT